MHCLSIISAVVAIAGTALASPAPLPVPAGKPTGGPAIATVTIYDGPATCSNPNTVSFLAEALRPDHVHTNPDQAPDPASAGTANTVTIAENSCAIINVVSQETSLQPKQPLTFSSLQPFGGVFTAKMTQAPKTGTTACYIQIFSQAGCGLTLQNQYHGFPFNGIAAGTSQVGCATPPVQSYGALQIVCA